MKEKTKNSEYLKHITDSSFDTDVINSPKPSIIDFWAEWCGPCRTLEPIFEELAKEYNSKFNFYKMNVRENYITSAKFGIKSIPTLIIFKNGKMVDQIFSGASKKQIAEILNKILLIYLTIGDIIYSPDGITEFKIYNIDQDRYWCEWSDKRGTFWMLKECLEKDITDGLYKIKGDK